MEFLRRLGSILALFWPLTAIRIMRRGAQETARFRAEHGREPTEAEWSEMARRVDREVTGR